MTNCELHSELSRKLDSWNATTGEYQFDVQKTLAQLIEIALHADRPVEFVKSDIPHGLPFVLKEEK